MKPEGIRFGDPISVSAEQAGLAKGHGPRHSNDVFKQNQGSRLWIT